MLLIYGTGIVHLGPCHGADDYLIAKKYNLPIECTVNEKGYMNEYAGKEVEGLFYEECSTKVLSLLNSLTLIICFFNDQINK